MQMCRGTHHLRDVNVRAQVRSLNVFCTERNMFRTNTEHNSLRLNVFLFKLSLLLFREREFDAIDNNAVFSVVFAEFRIKEVHLRRSDESCNEQICRMIKHFLRSTDLLNETVLHDDDTVAKGHSFCLIVRDIDERRVDSLTELDDLSTHLVAQFCV